MHAARQAAQLHARQLPTAMTGIQAQQIHALQTARASTFISLHAGTWFATGKKPAQHVLLIAVHALQPAEMLHAITVKHAQAAPRIAEPAHLYAATAMWKQERHASFQEQTTIRSAARAHHSAREQNLERGMLSATATRSAGAYRISFHTHV
jgi:hypothetical protein